MTRHAWFALALLAGSASAQAAESTRDALVADFTQAMGIEAMIDASRRQSEQMVVDQRIATIHNLRRSGLSDPALDEIGVSYDAIMERILGAWTAVEAARVYASAIAGAMSDQDLRKSIAFFRSTEGQRGLGAAANANTELQAYIQSSIAREMAPAMKEFADKVQAVTRADVARRASQGAAPARGNEASAAGTP